MATRMYRKMGVPCSRSAHARVFVDGEDFGVYTMLQDIAKRFLKDAFGTADHADDGNLYECEPPGCNLVWVGDRKSDYVAGSGDNVRGLVLQTNEDDPTENDYRDLIHFLDVLNNTPDEKFEAAIGEVFEVDTFLRWLATAVAISDYDNYLSSPTNFYLYHRPDTGRFVYVPVDHNRSYGVKQCKGSAEATGGGVDEPWCLPAERPLLERILAVPVFNQHYLDYLDEVLTSHFTAEAQAALIEELNTLAGALIREDPTSIHTPGDYRNSVSTVKGNNDILNLQVFVEQRRAFLVNKLANR